MVRTTTSLSKFRFRTSVLPALLGLYLLSALLHGGFSLSNVLNVLRIAIGVVLVGYGVRNWFRAVERSGRSLPINDVPDEGRNESTGFKKYYLVYLKYLVAAPLVSAFAL